MGSAKRIINGSEWELHFGHTYVCFGFLSGLKSEEMYLAVSQNNTVLVMEMNSSSEGVQIRARKPSFLLVPIQSSAPAVSILHFKHGTHRYSFKLYVRKIHCGDEILTNFSGCFA